MMHPARIAAALDDRFRLLTGGSRTVMPRQQTLEASVGLEPRPPRRGGARAAAPALGVRGRVHARRGRGRVRRRSRRRVRGARAAPRLVDKSLVQVDDEGEATPLPPARDHPPVRARPARGVGRERRDPRPAPRVLPRVRRAGRTRARGDATDRRCSPGWTSSTTTSAPRSSGPTLPATARRSCAWSRRLTLVLRAARPPPRAAPAGSNERSPRTTGAEPTAVPRARAVGRGARRPCTARTSRPPPRRCPQALAMAEQVGDEWAMARALNTIGYIELWSDPVAGRVAADQERRSSVRRSATQWAIADGLKMITVTFIVRGGPRRARGRALDDLLQAATRLDNAFFLAWYHAGVGYGALHQGEFERAPTRVRDVDRASATRSANRRRAVSSRRGSASSRGSAATTRRRAFGCRRSSRGPMRRARDSVCPTRSFNSRRSRSGAATRPAASEMHPAARSRQCRDVGLPMYHSWSLSVHGAALLVTGDRRGRPRRIRGGEGVAAPVGNAWLVGPGGVRPRVGRPARRATRTAPRITCIHARWPRSGCAVCDRPLPRRSRPSPASRPIRRAPPRRSRLFAAAAALRRVGRVGALAVPSRRGTTRDLARAA